MSRLREFKLPDLGEGLTEGEILGWLVAVGDTVTLNQPIVEVETAKAAVEVPSPYAGVVVTLHHGAGETVDVGSPIITVDTDPGAGPLPAGKASTGSGGAPRPPMDDLVPALPDTLDPNALDPDAPAAGLIGGAAPGGRTAILVGYGPKSVVAKRRARAEAGGGVPVQAQPVTDRGSTDPHSGPGRTGAAGGRTRVQAKPPVRKLARDLGVDLASIPATGPHGSVSRADVQGAAGNGVPAGAAAGTAGQSGQVGQVGPAGEERGAASRAGRRIPIKGVRKLTAQNMVASAFTAPHVTEWLTCDVTPTMELVGRLRALPDFAGIKLTPLTLVARALLVACRRNPGINATWDERAQEIVEHGGVNLGIAAATPRGLLVPNIKDADLLTLPGLARELTTLIATAREGRTQPADMAGGTITITNVGTFGVDAGTPILNPGEAAILCFGAVRDTPWVVDGQLAVRKVTTLALAFDHRLVDGQLGSQVLADLGAMLSDPAVLLAWS
ncbi:MAG TPA: dihydrolipoamide acetyltransferase family protein [Mycobacteriales bacterium]|nr:dihydrolipoamide acetyltransferase family protein [Mycobacteriales bacterium]